MSFAATRESSRAVFSGAESGDLYWESSDNIGVYLLSSPSGSYSGKSDFCGIELDKTDGTKARFTPASLTKVSDWTSELGAGSSLTFGAYYPVASKSVLGTYGTGGVELSVSPTQTDEFGRYQICASVPESMKKEELLESKPSFAFSPETSLLRMKFGVSSTSYDASFRITNISVKLVDTGSGSSTPALSGSCTLDFSQSKGSRLIAGPGATSSTVSYHPSEPIEISRGNASEYITFAVLPYRGTSSGSIDIEVTLETGSGIITYTLNKALPSGGVVGFMAGRRYNLASAIGTEGEGLDHYYIIGGEAWKGWSGVDVLLDGRYVHSGTAWDGSFSAENPEGYDGFYTSGSSLWSGGETIAVSDAVYQSSGKAW